MIFGPKTCQIRSQLGFNATLLTAEAAASPTDVGDSGFGASFGHALESFTHSAHLLAFGFPGHARVDDAILVHDTGHDLESKVKKSMPCAQL